MVSIKIEITSSKAKDVRRIRLEDLPSTPESPDRYSALRAFLASSFPSTNFSLKYKDDEGDMVTVASESELTEALKVSEHGKCPRFYLISIPSSESKPRTPEPIAVIPETKNYVVKASYQSKTESLLIPRDTTLVQLKLRIVSLFQDLDGKEFNLKYIDDEGDAVTMTEEDELVEAVQMVQDGQALALVVNASSQPEGEKPAKEEEEGKKKKQWEDVTWDDLNETLERLQKLGFTDTALATRLLEKYNYDFDAVLTELKESGTDKAPVEDD